MSLNGGPEVRAMQQKLCPFMERACCGNECSLWMQYDRADGVQFQGCTFVIGPILQQQLITESMRVQASSDKVATAVADGFGSFQRLAQIAAARRGNVLDSEVD